MRILTRVGAGIAIAGCLFNIGCGGVGIAEAGLPVISQVIPQTVSAGAGTTTVEVVGSHITDQTVVLWNGSPLATTVVDNTMADSPVESASLATPGIAQLQLMNKATGQKSNSVQINIAPSASALALTIATSSLPSATVGTPYSVTLAATGGSSPYSWSFSSGKMPAGLALSSSGIISGTPTAAGTFSIGLTVRDKSHPPQEKFIALTMVVSTNPLGIATTALAPASYGTAYAQTLQATGGAPSYTWSVTSGSLPPGLSLSASTGAISGIPTLGGKFPFNVTVSDNSVPRQIMTATMNITVGVTALNINTAALPPGIAGSAYSQALSASGGTPGYAWSVISGNLPAGLTLSSSGAITGTPSASGTFAFGVSVSDKSNPVQAVTSAFSISVNAVPLKVSTSALASGTAGSAYSQTLIASGGAPSYSWSITSGSLPAGLALGSAGAITGTPSASGTFVFGVSVSDKSNPVQTATATFGLTVAAVPLNINTASLASGTVGSAYSQSLSVSGGAPGYSWSITAGSLPAGLTLASSGLISGTLSTVSNSTFTATVKDSSNPVQSQSVSLSITSAATQLKSPRPRLRRLSTAACTRRT